MNRTPSSINGPGHPRGIVRRNSVQLTCLLLGGVLSTAATAADSTALASTTPAAATQGASDTASGLAPVVVTATRSARSELDVPASVDVLDAATVRDAQLRVNLSETLDRVPGLVLQNRQNYAQDLQLSIRGFGARAPFGERGVRLYVDGVPANFPDGQGQVSHFPLNAVDHIEVLRGPFSALYGNSAGGVVVLTTDLKPQPLAFEPSFALGAYNTSRFGFNAKGGQDGQAFNVDLERFRTDGYRQHSDARRDLLNIGTAFDGTPLGAVKVWINAIDMPWAQDAMGLTRAQYTLSPSAASPVALQFDTRKSTRQNSIGAQAQKDLGPGQLSLTAWTGARDVVQYQAIPLSTEAAATSPGGVIAFQRDYGGGDLRYALTRSTLTFAGGLDVERMLEHRQGYNNFTGTVARPTVLGIEGAERLDNVNGVDAIDPYLSAEWKIAPQWTADAGLRGVHVAINSEGRLAGTAPSYTSLRYDGTNPTAGLVFHVNPEMSVYGAWGRGFETPTLTELAYRPDGNPGMNTALQAARSQNGELGLKGSAAQSVQWSLAVFQADTTNDLVVATNSGGRTTYDNVARTKRHGEELAASWQITPVWSVAMSAANLSATFAQGFLTCVAAPCAAPTIPVAAGNHLPGVPSRTGFLEVKAHAWADVAATVHGESAVQVDDRNSDHAAGHATLDTSFAKTLAWGGARPRVFLRIDNLLDKHYAGSVIVDEANSRFFEGAPGRTWLVGMDYRM